MIRKGRVALLLLLIAASASAATTKRRSVRVGEVQPLITAGPVMLWDSLKPGPLTVGFRSSLLRAQASEFHHGPQHLVQISVWYPALANSGMAMTFRDYLVLRATENSYDDPTEAARQAAIDEFTKPLISAGVSEETALSIVNSPVIARLNAPTPISVVRSPIVFISQGVGQSAADQAVLAEFIASHGFIVVTTPSVTRLTGPLTSEDQIGLRAEEQADDVDRAASAIGDWSNAVNIPVSVIGYDLGADAALLYAMHQPTNAIVTLDATLTPGIAAALQSLPMFDASRRLPPILNLYENFDHAAPDLAFLNTSPVNAQVLTSMRHIHFTTIGFAAASSSEVARATGAGPNIRSDVAAMAQMTLDFLERIWAPIRPR